MSNKGRVLVGMSGGVDSSIAAMLLQEQGYEVTGITLRIWDYLSSGCSEKETGCCSLESIHEAQNLSEKFGFPHYIIDIREEFYNCVINNFIDEYLSGRTPNPCILCNTHIKWQTMLKKADELNCYYVATGHYANLREKNGRYIISKADDDNKDQSYFLWGLSQDYLKRTLLPLGKYKKPEIKQLAKEKGLQKLADKKESQEICFIPDNDYRKFLEERINEMSVANATDNSENATDNPKNATDNSEKVKTGNFISTDGKILGQHKGYPFYTIGQRKGLEIAVGHPLYVVEIQPEKNTIILGTREELIKTEMRVKDFNLIKYDILPENIKVTTKIRYQDKGTLSYINERDGKIKVKFCDNVSAIAPGQSAVFYEGNDLVGGGIIV